MENLSSPLGYGRRYRGSAMDLNPYEPTAQLSLPITRSQTHWYRAYVVPMSRIAFWFGTSLFILGLFVTFYPGAEAGWFAFTSVLVGFGAFVPKKSYRFATIVIASICLFGAFAGFQRGGKYQEWLKTQRQNQNQNQSDLQRENLLPQ
jgi:hypothetical protein